MADALLTFFRQTLPTELATLTEPYISKLEHGQYEDLLADADARDLFGHPDESRSSALEEFPRWNDFIFHQLGTLLADRTRPEKQSVFFCIGYAALLAFVQSNVTGPPLPFSPAALLLPQDVSGSAERTRDLRKSLLESLGMDGIAAYSLTPNVELLCLADAIFTCPPILKNIRAARWAKVRAQFLQQRLLSEVSSSLQDVIEDDLRMLDEDLLDTASSESQAKTQTEYLLEKATIHLHHGTDKFAKEDLQKAKDAQGFEFALTGLLGKRTKFQQTDVSQLVVLARSRSSAEHASQNGKSIEREEQAEVKPDTRDLNDDTLLESVSFTQPSKDLTKLVEAGSLPESLSTSDPADQPQLQSLDSTILLLLASSITNTSPQDGLTREETLPYATRVLEGGSSNWQVYTQALLVRSRIEGYRSRTVERGLLQLQALVDQVIAETGGQKSDPANSNVEATSSFLPRAKESESAPAQDRLRYVFQLASPTRWELEAELASRWVQLGGLRSALDIYERLEMWAEAALCWAATEREDKARQIVRRQLFAASKEGSEQDVDDNERWTGPPREPPPSDAPRLYCILGDIDQSTEMYEKAWDVSGQRYARAQRSLGRLFLKSNDYVKAAQAYSKSLKANQLNHSSWFALGCALLELDEFDKAVEAFSRCVQLDETDAEAWSNLAAALLRKDPEDPSEQDDQNALIPSIQKNRQDALQALKRAATLKHDSYRIWENVLIVSASTSPPDYTSILAAQKRIIDLRGSTDGEKCIDSEILHLLVQHVMSVSDRHDPEQPGLPRMVVKFVDQNVVPLITGSSRLWQLISKLALWRNKPSVALDAEEKAWRVVTSQPGWETESETRWDEVVEATVRLCDSYESLGPKEKTEGMGAGELVAKDWKFKARTAIRGILGRGKDSWEGTDGWERLQEVMKGLRG
ncbi:uncharacterized protein LTR77_000511 [Saxophila tyrrhenica]|uniref:TPR-like protein n=1 Tax=Saxophila tyrrhenica TaxID=1690608 RepID=A0AAV9PR20_9PEZI|nr:hypothetical protein LTR77_000511 [Saxophila tyrrhenica]